LSFTFTICFPDILPEIDLELSVPLPRLDLSPHPEAAAANRFPLIYLPPDSARVIIDHLNGGG
jgi:hypothetical protein